MMIRTNDSKFYYTLDIIEIPEYEELITDESTLNNKEMGDMITSQSRQSVNSENNTEILDSCLNLFNASIPAIKDNFTVFLNNDDYNCSNSMNITISYDSEMPPNWWGLVTILIVLLTTMGNILVILAISYERRLQNMTNYFLLSLAATDLMVAIFVMPIAIIVLVVGRFPFSSDICLLWISFDVLFCSASIMHLCTISVDRFLSLRFPMRFGRHKTRRRVVLKLVLVWCLSLSTSMPLSLMYAADTRSTIVDGVCQIPASLFQIIGSVFAFYVPLIIMIVTYALTVRLLSQKESELMAETPVMQYSHSVRLKRLLCKTTSTLSSTTATSIADTELSEVGNSEIDSDNTRSPNRRFKRHGSHYHSSSNVVTKDSKMATPKVSMDCHPISSSSSIKQKAHAKCDNHGTSCIFEDTLKIKDKNYNGFQKPCASMSTAFNITPEPRNDSKVEIKVTCDSQTRNDDSEVHSQRSTNVPCSCAPRFFLEGLSKSDNAPDVNCSSHYEDYGSTSVHKDSDSTAGRRKSKFINGICTLCISKQSPEEALDSPWHEGGRASNKPELRCSVNPPQPIMSNREPTLSSISSNKSAWRTRSYTPSMRIVSSKRHGRNLRLEKKATKVLGIVFSTFVILWSPFFIINLLLGACPSCIHDIGGDEMINFVTWLGYTSSTVNPFFYTFFNKSFRDAFLKILKCDMRLKRKYRL